MLFKDVTGQEPVKQQLVEMVLHNRISHALLFLGKEGSGALPLALSFAQYVSLQPSSHALATHQDVVSLFDAPEVVPMPSTPAAADEWMKKQSAFSKSTQMVHPDIHYSYPVVTKKNRITSSEHRLYYRMAGIHPAVSLWKCIRLAAIHWSREQTGKHHCA